MDLLFKQTHLIILPGLAADAGLWFIKLSRILLDHLSSQNDKGRYLSLLDHLSSVFTLPISACNKDFLILFLAGSERGRKEKNVTDKPVSCCCLKHFVIKRMAVYPSGKDTQWANFSRSFHFHLPLLALFLSCWRWESP
ncbi:hypothetical protein P0Y67_15945 [Photobacterium sp. SP02]|uniref:hypothetical protein n=1 Tax=Photobacterium sp. SP02 TaxID=3032280 RepID=UPI00314522AD